MNEKLTKTGSVNVINNLANFLNFKIFTMWDIFTNII